MARISSPWSEIMDWRWPGLLFDEVMIMACVLGLMTLIAFAWVRSGRKRHTKPVTKSAIGTPLAYLLLVGLAVFYVVAGVPRRQWPFVFLGFLGFFVAPIVVLSLLIYGVLLILNLKYHDAAVTRIVRESGGYADAATVLAISQLIEREGPTLARLLALGACHLAQGDFENARRAYERAHEINRKDRVARVNLALTLMNLGDLDEAEAIYRSLVAEKPMEVYFLVGLCQVLAKQNRWTEAAAVLRDAEAARAATTAVGRKLQKEYNDALNHCRELLAAKADPQIPGQEL